jgi:hypothetical protein
MVREGLEGLEGLFIKKNVLKTQKNKKILVFADHSFKLNLKRP